MTIAAAKDVLKKYFGFESFRPMQAEIIQAVYDKRDTLVLMPTGGGKSLCYQLPAITVDGCCVVVSPLISLMKDQVESLRASGIKAAFLNSSLSLAEQSAVEDDLYNGHLNLLYVSPEKLLSQQFLPLLKRTNVNLFAIDEAHCISSWGHDFRQEYTQLSFLKRQFADVPITALTATADKITRNDIIRQLQLDQPEIFIASFDRPNISLEVRPGQRRAEQIIDFIRQRPGQSGIIYCLSRRNTEDVCARLLKQGIRAAYYHAGMNSAERSKVQEDFINDRVPVVCATVAFGMGIDKSNVRWVMHYNLPKSIESYYQEIGRAGRDGAKAEALMFYSYRDVSVLRDLLQQNESDLLEIKLAKLERIRQFADSLICRRKILLSYFGEDKAENCGNCDVCKDPPQQFDGTVVAQKALSAIARLKESVGMNMLIDVLRGSKRRDLLQRGYDRIKTYGAGADISAFDWQQLLMQMVNLGLLEIAYDQHHVLKLTPVSRSVLFEGRKVQLVKMLAYRERMKAAKEAAKPISQRQRVRDELFEVLRQLRRGLAQKQGIPPYIIFSDASLEDMAANRPLTEQEFQQVSGVGEAKLRKYGRVFIQTIRNFVADKGQQGTNLKGASQVATQQLFRRGFSPEQIAQERALSIGTVYGHLAEAIAAGEKVEIQRLVDRAEMKRLRTVIESMEQPFKLKEIFEAMDEQLPYHKIKIILAYFDKQLKISSL